MAKINITITATVQALSNFADGLGYQTRVQKPMAEINALPPSHTIEDTLMDNPQSKTDFLLEYLKTITVNKLAEQQLSAISTAYAVEKETQKQTVKDNIASAITVTLV